MRPAVGLLLFYKEKSEENENMKNYKIAVAGTGYVGLSLSVLLAQHNQVMAVDIVQAKVDMINNHKSPIQDDYIPHDAEWWFPITRSRHSFFCVENEDVLIFLKITSIIITEQKI